jgi:hypothetical protein
MARSPRRLPGIRFEEQAPPLTDTLPRMDVAAFVGFAAAGPLHTPVVVEGSKQFAAIFGDDLPLAWDATAGQPISAYLGPVVRAFFRNGGQRCWVVRVAGPAQPNYFPLTGLLQCRANQSLVPAFALAKSAGSGSDAWTASATLVAQSLELVESQPVLMTRQQVQVDLAASSPDSTSVVVGDLVRVSFQTAGVVAFFPVEQIQSVPSADPAVPPSADSPPVVTRLTSSRLVWLTTQPPAGALAGPAWAYTFATDPPDGVPERALAGEAQPLTPDFTSKQIPAYNIWPATATEPLTVQLGLSLQDAPALGSLLRVDVDTSPGTAQLWLRVGAVQVAEGAATAWSPPVLPASSPPSWPLQVSGEGLWSGVAIDPSALPAPDAVEKLTLTLWARQTDQMGGSAQAQRPTGTPIQLTNLAFTAKHPRFWAALPTAEQLYDDPDTVPTGLDTGIIGNSYTDLWADAVQQSFPLAGNLADADLYLPVAMPLLPDIYLSALRRTATALERDGLIAANSAGAAFDPQRFAGLFLDPDVDLLGASGTELLARADYLRYLSPAPRRLRGMHACLSVDEATIIAVPDAVHRGWHKIVLTVPPDAVAPVAPPPLDRSTFQRCDLRALDAPQLTIACEPDTNGAYTLAWYGETFAATAGTTTHYELEESINPSYAGAQTVYVGEETQYEIFGRSSGTYYYRVRVLAGRNTSGWSAGQKVVVVPVGGWLSDPTTAYSTHEPALLAIHWSLVRLCAARGDLFALLSLPGHYRADDAKRYLARLKTGSGSATVTPQVLPGSDTASPADSTLIAPLSLGEASAFSYAAAYHPWIMGRDERDITAFLQSPPDGALAGVLAQRSLARGAWIAPANEPLFGVAALTPVISSTQWLSLLNTQLNVIRQDPRGFMALSAETLSDDDLLVPINVRRLLILLRRLAMRLGTTYVFEPNSPAFRRSVQRGFEAQLGQLFARGAFAGAAPEQAFQVVTGSALNTPQSIDQGIFMVELRVAPSLPLTFLTVRLVQTTQQTLLVEAS